MLHALLLLAAQAPSAETPGLLEFFLQSGPVARVVLGILFLFSVASWTIMISKYLQFRRVGAASERFLTTFRKSARFSEINAVTAQHSASPLVGMFQAGYVEIDAQVKALRDRDPDQSSYRIKSLTGVERSLRRAAGIEMQILSRHAQFLATTAAATPFIGLFGTVWGIMIAFNDIGATGSASIAVVAPGIAEALVNTAAGLVAAIPALIGYNQLAARIRSLRVDMDDFALELLNLAERNFT
jgi:biopolymer transport protein TolQ